MRCLTPPPALALAAADKPIVISPTIPLSKSLSMPGLASNPCPLEFDAIASTEAFRSVLASTEKCLLGNRGVPTLFAFQSPAMTFTGLVTEEVLDRQVPSELEPACKRLRLSVSRTDLLGPCAFFLPLSLRDGDDPWFAFIRANGAIGVACLHQQPVESDTLHIGPNCFQISLRNGLPWNDELPIVHGDVLFLSCLGQIRAGGHRAGGPHVLAPSFEARCEFAVNTSGWIATDEMTFWLQHVQWAAPGYSYFSMPVTWDEENGDFDFGLSAVSQTTGSL